MDFEEFKAQKTAKTQSDYFYKMQFAQYSILGQILEQLKELNKKE